MRSKSRASTGVSANEGLRSPVPGAQVQTSAKRAPQQDACTAFGRYNKRRGLARGHGCQKLEKSAALTSAESLHGNHEASGGATGQTRLFLTRRGDLSIGTLPSAYTSHCRGCAALFERRAHSPSDGSHPDGFCRRDPGSFVSDLWISLWSAAPSVLFRGLFRRLFGRLVVSGGTLLRERVRAPAGGTDLGG